MTDERDTAEVVLDMLAGMQLFHDGSELGEVYAELYQLVAQRLLADEHSQQAPAERALGFLNVFYRLPEPDQRILRILLKEVLVPAE